MPEEEANGGEPESEEMEENEDDFFSCSEPDPCCCNNCPAEMPLSEQVCYWKILSLFCVRVIKLYRCVARVSRSGSRSMRMQVAIQRMRFNAQCSAFLHQSLSLNH